MMKNLNKFNSKIKVIKPSKTNNLFYYLTGLGFLFLAKIKNLISGYTTPRTFSINEIDKAIKYDFKVVNCWLDFLKFYSGKSSIKTKSVLELGPGADLGIGLILLMKGVKKYNAIDVNDLIESVPDNFYDKFFKHAKKNFKFPRIAFLRSQLERTQKGKNNNLNYVCRKDFDLSVFKNESIDLIFSQAAFEHFDNVEETISKLSKFTKKGTLLIVQIDLRTHSRWIRDADPLNIYRYSDFIYNLFKFRGMPNRVRTYQYKKILRKHGWTDIKIAPLSVLEENYFYKIRNTLNKKFRNDSNQMEYLSIMLGAKKK